MKFLEGYDLEELEKNFGENYKRKVASEYLLMTQSTMDEVFEEFFTIDTLTELIEFIKHTKNEYKEIFQNRKEARSVLKDENNIE